MQRELTTKEKRLANFKAHGMSGAAAARKAGYSKRSARQIASETLSKPDVRAVFLKAMKNAGITDEATAKVIRDGMEANRAISAVVGTDATGKTMDFVDVPDHPTRLKAAKMVVDIKGLEAAKQVNLRDQTLEDLLNLDDDDGGPDNTTEGAG